ncbi:MAG: nucleotidyltransferase family protein, partial [Halanaerobiales bacterium]
MKTEIPSEIIEKYGINLLVLFGSYADGTNRQDSDLDLAFLSKEILSLDKEHTLLEEMIGYYRKGNLD